MKLHANAALSLKGRRQLCRRVVDERWTLTEAAEAAGVSVRCARKWVGRYRAEGELGLLDRSSAPGSDPASHRASERVEAIAALGGCGSPARRSPRRSGMALSTVSGILTRIGMGKLGRLGLEPAQRYERERPGELIHIDVKKLGRIQGGAGHRVTGQPQYTASAQTPPASARDRRLGVRAHRDRRLHPPGLRRGPRRREGHHRGRLPAPRRRVLRRHGITVEQLITDNGSRLPLDDPRDRLPRARDPPPPHPPLPPPDQRQSRTLHPHHARRLGLRRDLPQQPRTHRSP